MKSCGWIFAGLGIGVSAYILFARRPDVRDGMKAAAGRTRLWGRQQRFSGAVRYGTGKLKRGIGQIAGNDALVGEGMVDQVAGAVKYTVGKVAGTVGETLHDVNRSFLTES